MYLKTLDFIVIAMYFLGMFLLGALFSKQRGADDYYLAGRRVSSLLAGVSVFATLFSTMSYLALPGEMIRHGIGFFSSLLAFIFIIPMVVYIIIPSLMRLPVTTVYDYLEKRFDVSVRKLGAWVFVIIRLVWMGLILYTAARAVAPMTGWSVPVLILITGVITVAYTTMGGMRAVVWSDFAQFSILLGGALLVPIYIAFQTGSGPMEWWSTFSAAERAAVPVFSFDLTQRITIVGMIVEMFVWNVCTHGADQVAAQRYLSTPSAAAAQRSFIIFSIANVGVLSLLMVVGVALFFFRFQMSELPIDQFQADISTHADDVLPQFIAAQLPTGISGLLLAALLAAAMSSVSSGINSISAVAVNDLLRTKHTAAGVASRLGLSRGLAAFAGGISIAGALLFVKVMDANRSWNLVDLLERLNHLFVAPLGAVFFAGIFFRHVGAKAVVLGFITGVAASFLIAFSEWFSDYQLSFMWIMPGSFMASLLATYLFGFCFKPPAKDQLASLSHRQ